MKAYQLNAPGDISQLQIINIAKPFPSENEVLVKVKAISINPVDVKVRIGKAIYEKIKEDRPVILGWDVSGIVETIGSKVTRFKVGDQVFGMINFPGHGKSYAEYVTAPEDHLTIKPENISHEEAAATSLAALTAFQVLRNHVKENDRILIQAGAGGVGHFAVQIGKILGAKVIATTSTQNIDFVKSLGADDVIDYTQTAFEDVLKNLDFVLNALNEDVLRRSILTVKKGGTIITLPSGGNSQETFDLAKEYDVIVSHQQVKSNGSDMHQLAEWLSEGKLKATISKTFSFDDLPQAHTLIETGRTRGKIVVSL
ncbi:MAG: NADP-dependent oxidoreductase [Bacteroidetes bacterium]|nr:NADP-dependent oxidoreductase [Bacteroidota bacterium]